MSFLNFKTKSNKNPSIESLRRSMFEIRKFWYITIVSFFALVSLFVWIGFDLFSYEYFERYKQEKEEQLPTEIINIELMKNIVEKRDLLLNKEFAPSTDPSI